LRPGASHGQHHHRPVRALPNHGGTRRGDGPGGSVDGLPPRVPRPRSAPGLTNGHTARARARLYAKVRTAKRATIIPVMAHHTPVKPRSALTATSMRRPPTTAPAAVE